MASQDTCPLTLLCSEISLSDTIESRTYHYRADSSHSLINRMAQSTISHYIELTRKHCSVSCIVQGIDQRVLCLRLSRASRLISQVLNK